MKVNGHFATLSQGGIYGPQMVVAGQGYFPQPIYNRELYPCSMKDTPNLGRYEASLELVLPPQKTSNRGMYCL